MTLLAVIAALARLGPGRTLAAVLWVLSVSLWAEISQRNAKRASGHEDGVHDVLRGAAQATLMLLAVISILGFLVVCALLAIPDAGAPFWTMRH